MANESNTEIQHAGKAGLAKLPEQTRPGPMYTPAADIFETDDTITVLADMPGVRASDLAIDLRDNTLTLSGRVTALPGEGESVVLREYSPGTFFRQFSLADSIDQAKIDAKLKDGVLRLELPKAEKARPRQIQVRAG
jgi:HSP20 family protein